MNILLSDANHSIHRPIITNDRPISELYSTSRISLPPVCTHIFCSNGNKNKLILIEIQDLLSNARVLFDFRKQEKQKGSPQKHFSIYMLRKPWNNTSLDWILTTVNMMNKPSLTKSFFQFIGFKYIFWKHEYNYIKVWYKNRSDWMNTMNTA